MISNGFTRSNFDYYVYHKKLQDSSFIYRLLYVDNILITVHDMKDINILKSQLNNKFEMEYLDVAKKILSMEISRDRAVGKLYML